MKKRSSFFHYSAYTSCLLAPMPGRRVGDNDTSAPEFSCPDTGAGTQATVIARVRHTCVERRTAGETVGRAMLS
ncbi:hypothetical protein DB346_14260 [Verrucomicrobia bacterium LW23]|nr:hypothetical protein DB346_14260 [Verrucomicrobia bacterium LW23]